jgi:pimeloyl-ACP methyl ester carboxylesterase
MSELMLEVSASVPFDATTCLAASVHLPDIAAGAPRAVLVCWPGGSYGRAYWDMQIPGYPGYSFADHVTAQGYLVVTADPLGVGASSKPGDGDRVNLETMSAACAAFVEQVRALLAAACLTVVTQARHRCYDAVALLGFTHGQKELSVTAVGAATADPDATAHTLREAASEQARAFFGDTWDDVYGLVPREPHHGWLHRPDVPPAVIAADDAAAVRWPRQAYVDALLVGYSAGFAAHLDCSIFVGFGDHDVPPVPHADVAFYTRSPDVTLYVLPDAAHCHNFAATRTQLWDRIDRWAGALPNV